MDTYYSVLNIDSSNNTIQISHNDDEFLTLTLDKGCYGLDDLNQEISRQLKGRKTNFREPQESVDTYLIGKTLFTASKTAPASCRYTAPKSNPTKNDM